MTDIELLVRECLHEQADATPSGDDLLIGARERGRGLVRRRRVVIGGAAVAATTVAGVGVGLTFVAGSSGGSPARVTVPPLESAATSTPVSISPGHACPDGQVAQVTQTSGQPVATGQLDSAGTGTDGSPRPVAISEMVRDYLESPSMTQDDVAWASDSGAVVGGSTGLLPWVVTGDDANSGTPTQSVVLELTDGDSAWAAYPVSFDSCVPDPN